MLSMVLPDVWTSILISFQDVGPAKKSPLSGMGPTSPTLIEMMWSGEEGSSVDCRALGPLGVSFLFVWLFFFLFSEGGWGVMEVNSVSVSFCLPTWEPLILTSVLVLEHILQNVQKTVWKKLNSSCREGRWVLIFFFLFALKIKFDKKKGKIWERGLACLPVRPLTYVDVSLHSNKMTKLKGSAACFTVGFFFFLKDAAAPASQRPRSPQSFFFSLLSVNPSDIGLFGFHVWAHMFLSNRNAALY